MKEEIFQSMLKDYQEEEAVLEQNLPEWKRKRLNRAIPKIISLAGWTQ
ncbi:MAG: hypothetical protein ACOX7P_02365 [Oscillospiraceae bacterium]